MNNWRPGTRNDDRNDDKPPYSRIFIVCNKQVTLETLRSTFQTFGNIEDLRMPVDRGTGDSKGIAYIKYSKTSSAAAAINAMHLKTIDNCSKPLKVMIATNKHDNTNSNDEKYKRLFIKVSKDLSENDIKQHFSNYGHVESVYIQKDKLTEQSRGFAYVYFRTFLDAAKALEECDRKYKPVFATPKDELKRSRNSTENLIEHHLGSATISKDSYDHCVYSRDNGHKDNFNSLIKTKPQDYNTVCVTCSPQVQQKYIERLFNIVPGMAQFKYSCDSFNGFCKAIITYETDKAAAYVVNTLNNFEFPSGEIISVKPDNNPLSKAASSLSNIVNSFKNAIETDNPDLLQLADAIAQASTLIKAATSGREMKLGPQDDFCSVTLPPLQPFASTNSTVIQRCFIVFKPHPPPISALKDAFCRFGDLIDVSTFPNKTFGFAKYASTKAAQDAIKTLHGAVLCGVSLKVFEADEKPNKDENKSNHNEDITGHNTERKRMKFDSNDNSMT